MSELKRAKEIIDIANQIAKGVDATRDEILKMAGSARYKFMKADLQERLDNGISLSVPKNELKLQLNIIGELDQSCRRMACPQPSEELNHISQMIEELERIRSSKQKLPISPGLSIWRGEVELRHHNFSVAIQHFTKAIEVLNNLEITQATVPETLVAALCESAYAYAMHGNLKEAIKLSTSAIKIAREHKKDEKLMEKFLRDNFIAGQDITAPLASAYLMACDIRINDKKELIPDSQIDCDIRHFWNKLNDEFNGLSAIQIPHLMAILSDRNWMSKRPELAAPISRALYLKTSSNIPEALWRRANLLLGGFQLTEVKKSRSSVAAAALIIFTTITSTTLYTKSDASDFNVVKYIQTLSTQETTNLIGLPNVTIPSGEELLALSTEEKIKDIDILHPESSDFFRELKKSEPFSEFNISTGGSSNVGTTLV